MAKKETGYRVTELSAFMDKLKKMKDQERALVDDQKKKILKEIDERVEALEELGFTYELREVKRRGLVDPDKDCPVCKFRTDPPHDKRSHRFQKKNKKQFTKAELDELVLRKID